MTTNGSSLDNAAPPRPPEPRSAGERFLDRLPVFVIAVTLSMGTSFALAPWIGRPEARQLSMAVLMWIITVDWANWRRRPGWVVLYGAMMAGMGLAVGRLFPA